MTGGGLSPAGHKSRGYPGYELTNSVRVLPQPPITYVSVGGEPNSSVRIAKLAELMISRIVCCMNGAGLARVLAHRIENMIVDFINITDYPSYSILSIIYLLTSFSLQNKVRR